MGDVQKFFKDAAIQIGSGGSAGFVEVCIMHPLDVVKTRLQLQSTVKGQTATIHHYTGIIDCLAKIQKHEGLFAFWKGILPPILAETPKRALKFVTFEQYKRFFLFGAPSPTPLTFALAGLCAGITEAVFINPFEVVKVTLQSDKTHMKELPSTWTVTKRIVNSQGFGPKGLFRGLSATITRNGIFNCAYFGFYHSVKGKIGPIKDPTADLFCKLGIGFLSGTLGSCLNIPFDVAKSRMQGPQPDKNYVKYKSMMGSLAIIYREEGWRALFKGLAPKVMRLGPGGGIMLVVYDYSHSFLKSRFPD